MIALENVTKVFRLPHERKTTLRQRFVSVFHKDTYEELYALRNINLRVNEGEFLGIIGRNGAGKSTLLKLMAGVLQPTSGTVCVCGNIAPFLELSVGFQGELTVKDNIILTPPPTADILLGITRKVVIKLARKEGIEVKERDTTLYELYNADEAFLTGTAAEVIPLVEVDGKEIGDGKHGPVTKRLIDAFRRIRKSGTPI